MGHVYESSARVDVGGDVYDFLTLDDGRLAIILGDVTGKGIQAAADMAMAKFSFRALARMHPEPADFLARANEVIVDEIGVGKFITMLYVLVDPKAGTISCASAGHPAARLVDPEGNVLPSRASGLALGIEPDQEYETEQAELRPGVSVVLYTDGVPRGPSGRRDVRRGAAGRAAAPSAQASARRSWRRRSWPTAGASPAGELGDDCALVCLRLSNSG